MEIDATFTKFQTHLRISHSDRTVTTYRTALNHFADFLALAGLDPTENRADVLTVDHAIDFVEWLVDECFDGQIATSTLQTYLTGIARFYAYCIREQCVDVAAEDYERMKQTYSEFRRGNGKRLPKPAPEGIVADLVKAARTRTPQPDDRRYECRRLRDIAIIETLRCTGVRVGELVALTRGTLDHRNQAARVIGKGDKERIVYFDDAAWKAIQTYLQYRGDGARGHQFYKLPVFARHDKAAGSQTLPISTNTVRAVFNQLAAAAGIDQPVTPHSLRHSFGTRALEVTGDLASVQDLLGHADPKTTRIYAKVSSKRLHAAHQQIFGYEKKEED